MTWLPWIVLAVSIVGASYSLLIYPMVLWLLARTTVRRDLQSETSDLPRFTVIIPAHNEERVIAAKLQNTLGAARFTGTAYQIVVAADGCTDRTVEIARSIPEVEVVEVEKRGGIVGAFTAGFARAKHDIIFFSDADILLDQHAFAAMLRHFAHPTVGGVCGSTRMAIRPGSGLTAERVNVAYRRWVRLRQSIVHSSIGADGANWALRRELVRFPKGQLAEDLVMPLEAIHSGLRFVYEPEAGALETSPWSVKDEYYRKVRTIAGGIQAAFYCQWMFTRQHAATGFHYVSWKLCKYAIPIWGVLGFAGALAIPALAWPAALLIAVLVTLSVVGRVAGRFVPGPMSSLLAVPWYALVASATPLAALWLAIRHRSEVRWRMAAR
ncbi:MAG: glycosyltransferase [Deltaproteobacteria bacterium]|nr:glycosyltransferase [Deltaproteobacteria bacterium]